MGNDPELGKLRRALHRLDAKLLQLLPQRPELASRLALKKEALLALRDEVREREILTRVASLAQEQGVFKGAEELEDRPRLSGFSKERCYSKPGLLDEKNFARVTPGGCSELEGISAD